MSLRRLCRAAGPQCGVLHVDGVTWLMATWKAWYAWASLHYAFARFLLEHINAAVIILSTRMKDYLAAHDFILPNLQLIPNGVDTTRFRQPKTVISPDEKAHSWSVLQAAL